MSDTGKKNANPMWGGHYAEGPEEIMTRINASIDVDKRLYAQDIAGSIAHCDMLAKAKIIPPEDAKKIVKGLQQIRREIEDDLFDFSPALEDIHMNIEHRLHQLIGESAAGKLHTARSRNDQVATDFRLYAKEACLKADAALQHLQKALYGQALKHTHTVMPGFTHLQTAQPVTFGHHLHAYIEMFGRDRSRFRDAAERMNESPLGAAALAGTTFPIDRKATAKALGFDRPCANSMDAVSARDFALEYLSCASICVTHISRLAEELVLWCSAGFNFVKLPESLTTGSSIMPQKRNPDAAELARAKTGSVFGALIGLLTVMKGLTLTYSKDMQEDKAPFFRASDDVMLCINAMAGMAAGLKVNESAMRDAAGKGYSDATDLADWLVREKGVPFRKAHHIVGAVVREAEERGCTLSELPLEAMQKADKRIDENVFTALGVDASVAARASYGGTAPDLVAKALKAAKKEYDL